MKTKLKMNLQLFASSGTRLSDIIVPELFNPYVINRTMEKSALVQVHNNNTIEFDNLALAFTSLLICHL